jgi:hypothetical protein
LVLVAAYVMMFGSFGVGFAVFQPWEG